MSCVFCGADEPLTKEHLWSDWIAGVVTIAEDTTYMQRFGEQGEQLREYQQKPFDQQVRAVCEDCNSGWMSRVEGAVKPYAKATLLGQGRHLHRRAQAALSMWATMKLLVGEHTQAG